MPVQEYIELYNKYGATVLLENGKVVAFNSKEFDMLQLEEQKRNKNYLKWRE